MTFYQAWPFTPLKPWSCVAVSCQPHMTPRLPLKTRPLSPRQHRNPPKRPPAPHLCGSLCATRSRHPPPDPCAGGRGGRTRRARSIRRRKGNGALFRETRRKKGPETHRRGPEFPGTGCVQSPPPPGLSGAVEAGGEGVRLLRPPPRRSDARLFPELTVRSRVTRGPVSSDHSSPGTRRWAGEGVRPPFPGKTSEGLTPPLLGSS